MVDKEEIKDLNIRAKLFFHEICDFDMECENLIEFEEYDKLREEFTVAIGAIENICGFLKKIHNK